MVIDRPIEWYATLGCLTSQRVLFKKHFWQVGKWFYL